VDRYLERTYHAERLTTPLRRVGPKGSGQFEPVTWEEALTDIAARLHSVIDEYGPEAVLPYSFAGTMGLLQKEGVSQRFFNRMGASRLARTICSQAGKDGYAYTIGDNEGMESESYAHAKLILIWGSNTLTSNLHLWPFIQEALKAGARLVVIDPARTRTARAAESSGNGEWIPIRPGTDGALALAMMHVIINEGLYDADYIEYYTLGADALAERVQEWPPERAAEITGIPAQRIRSLAIEYATIRPAAIRINYGLQRHIGGGMAVRNIACLPALVGAWREVGGGIQLNTSGYFRHLDLRAFYRPDLLYTYHPGRIPRMINMNRLGDALSLDPVDIARSHAHPRPVDPVPTPDKAGPPIKAMIVYNCNPVTIAPDQRAVVRGMMRDDLFTVVLEHFQTDSADYADYVLPATTQLEHWDLLQAYGHINLSLNQPAIEPVGQSLPNSEIFRRLAQAMGYDDDCFLEEDVTMLQNLISAQSHPAFETITWSRLMDEGFVRLNMPQPYLPFAQGEFPTASGKCEFYSAQMANDGYNPLPTYTPSKPEKDTVEDLLKIPEQPSFTCISPPAHSFLNSSFANLERFRKREAKPVVQIHPTDAASYTLQSGDHVRVWNERGSVELVAQLTTDIMQGTLLAPGIWWMKHSPDGVNINQITGQEETDMGAGATFYEAQVWLDKV